MVAGLLIGIPEWARDERGLPAGLWLPHDDAGNTWAAFVREAVSRYDGRIHHWIIWNEPDITDTEAPGHTWDGDIEDFFQLQRIAYLAAKEVNPEVTIHLAAFTHFWDPDYFDRFLDVVTADPNAMANDYYFDVATAHLYFQPNSIYDIIRKFYAALGRHGILKPIWLVETNAPPIDDPTWPVPNWTLKVTQNEQAAFIPQALASALAAGAQRIAIYKLKDTPDDRQANPEPFGLVRMDGSRRPAFNTYSVAIRYLAGVTTVARERWDEVGQIRIDQNGQSTTVLFARLPAPQQAQIPATADSAILVDMWGTQQTIRAENGLFTLDLPAALCTQPIGDYCMIGGTTYYLVQATGDSLPAATPNLDTILSTLIPTRPPTATPTATTTPSTTPTLSPSATATPTPSLAPPTPTAAATAVAEVVDPSPAVTVTATPTSTNNGPAYWLIAAGLLLGVAVLAWWINGRRA